MRASECVARKGETGRKKKSQNCMFSKTAQLLQCRNDRIYLRIQMKIQRCWHDHHTTHTNVCSYDKMRYAFVCMKSVNGMGNASFEYFSNLCPHALSLKVAYVRVFFSPSNCFFATAIAACFTVVVVAVVVILGFLLVFSPQLLEMCVRLCFVFYIRYL